MRSIKTVACALLCLAPRGVADDHAGSVLYAFSAEVLSIDIAQKAQLGPDVQTYCYDPKEIADAREGRIVVGIDANWSIQTIIRQTGPDSGPFQSGAKVEFLVHSPTHVCLGQKAEAVGKVIDFTLSGSQCTTDTVSFSMLTKIVKKKGEPGATDNPDDAQHLRGDH